MSDFVSFADYLGLNDEAGQQMLNRSMEQGNKLRGEADAAGQAHANFAKEAGSPGGEAQFQRSGEVARSALASYGEFMQGMADPAARQALMEKTYGKGAVSALDSALAGSRGVNTSKEFDAYSRDAEKLNVRADERRTWAKGEAKAQAENEQKQADAEAKFWTDRKAQQAKQAVDFENRRIDAYGRANTPGGYDPTRIRGTGNNVGGSGNASQYSTDTNADTQREWVRRYLADQEKQKGLRYGGDTNGFQQDSRVVGRAKPPSNGSTSFGTPIYPRK